MVGTYQYLMLTRLDISYAVNVVSQFIDAPTLLIYLYATYLSLFMEKFLSRSHLKKASKLEVVLAYSDAG